MARGGVRQLAALVPARPPVSVRVTQATPLPVTQVTALSVAALGGSGIAPALHTDQEDVMGTTANVATTSPTVHRVRTKRQRRWWERAFLHPWPTISMLGHRPAGIPRTA